MTIIHGPMSLVSLFFDWSVSTDSPVLSGLAETGDNTLGCSKRLQILISQLRFESSHNRRGVEF